MSSNERSISRRQTLKAVGISSTALTTVPSLVGASTTASLDETVSITTVEGSGEPKVRKQVPIEWWTYEQKADRLMHELRTRYADREEVKGVGLGTLDERIAGRQKSFVNVSTRPERGSISTPDHVEGVPVRNTEADVPKPNACNTGDFDDVPGGVSVNKENTSTGASTSTCKVEYNGNYYLMTCAHMWGCDEGLLDASLYQSTQYIGDLYNWDKTQDWVISSLADNSGVSSFVNRIEENTGKQCGHVTRDGLFDLKSKGTTVYHQGITEKCKTEHSVSEIDTGIQPCSEISNRYVKVSNGGVIMDGDSGGPLFHQYKQNGQWYVAIIAPLYGSTSAYGWGCAAYWINQDKYINFDPNNCS